MVKAALILIPEKIQKLIKDYTEDLEQIWANCGEEPLNISFGAKIGVVRGKNLCEVSISFTKEKVKDMVSFEWNANQGKLFETIKKMDDNLKKDKTTLTISDDSGKSVTLGAKT